MSEKPERSPRVAFMEALGVPRNAKVGGVTGFLFAIAVYVLFAVAPSQTSQSPALLVVLAFVVAVSTAILVTTLLTVRNAARLTMSPPKWIRGGGQVAAVGAVAWVALGLLSVAVGSDAGVPESVLSAARLVFPVPLLGLVYGTWAVHAVNRQGRGYPRTPREFADSVPWMRRETVATLVGGLCFWSATLGHLFVAWIALVEPDVLLGLPTRMPSTIPVGAYLLALLGTSLLGGAALRADEVPRPGSLPLVFAFPAGLAALTGLAYLSVTGSSGGVLGVVLGLAWTPVAVHLARGEGVPPDAAFETRRAERFEELAPDGNASDPDDAGGRTGSGGARNVEE